MHQATCTPLAGGVARTIVLVDAQEGVQSPGVLVLGRVRLGLRHEPRLDEQQRVRHHRRPQLRQRADQEDLQDRRATGQLPDSQSRPALECVRTPAAGTP
jgi:hypothetical protein